MITLLHSYLKFFQVNRDVFQQSFHSFLYYAELFLFYDELFVNSLKQNVTKIGVNQISMRKYKPVQIKSFNKKNTAFDSI